MAHPYHKEAKEGHAKKLSGYGGKGKTYDGKGTWDGLKGLGNEDQAGLKIIDKEPSLSEETAPRIMRKKGGKVMGKKAIARLDKPKRKGRDAGGQLPSPYEAAESEKRMKNIDYSDDREGGTTSASEAASSAGRQEDKRGGRVKRADGGSASQNNSDKNTKNLSSNELYQKAKMGRNDPNWKPNLLDQMSKKHGGYVKRAAGGKLSKIEWEHSKKDLAQDKKLAKKHGMKLEKWEHSKLDEKHDKQQSTEGLRSGGRAKRERGGPVKGKTTVNIIVGAGGKPQDQMGAGNIAPVPGIPVGSRPQMPPPPAYPPPMAPPMMGAPMAAPPAMAPPPAPPMGGGQMMPPPGGNPLMRKAGGRANADVPVKTPGRTPEGYPKMDYGAVSGKGRRQKIIAQTEGSRKGFK